MSYTKRFKLDFEALRAWRSNTEDKIPVNGFLAFYDACGLIADVKPVMEERKEAICPIQHIFCNFDTLKRIHDLIRETWEYYNLTIKEDNKVRWKIGKSHERRSRPYKLNSSISNSLKMDEHHYSPNIDDELEDNILVFQVLDPQDEPPRKHKVNVDVK